MVELQHCLVEPALLTAFRAENPGAAVSEFDGLPFRPVKVATKVALNQDQGGLCVYCEQPLVATEGQVDHIKPKGGANAHPLLCFIYTNYAHSCIRPKTCGQKKKNGVLPIEPGPGCNDEWTLSTTGTIEPLVNLSRNRKHAVRKTWGMLGLNADANLVDERQKWLNQTIRVLQQAPESIHTFLQTAPFRHILATLV
jgi:uncharacterized protein (TIGR02646 family)